MKKWKIRLIIASFIISIIFACMYKGATQFFYETGSAQFNAELTTAVYNSLGEHLIDQNSLNDFVKINVNQNGDISHITTNTFEVNHLAQVLADKTMKYFQNNSSKNVKVPLGAFTGIKILSGVGKEISIKMINVTSVKCEFFMDFDEAGINQTRQTLILKVIPDVTIVSLGFKRSYNTEIEVLVYDNLIVGKVPNTYLNSMIIGKSS